MWAWHQSLRAVTLASRAVVAGSRDGIQDGPVEEVIWEGGEVGVHVLGEGSFLTSPLPWAGGAIGV